MQRAGDAGRFRVEIAHSGIQVRMPKDGLKIMYERPVLERMSGKGMPQVMRGESVQMPLVGGSFDGALDVGRMTPPTDLDAGARVKAGAARGKEPGPTFGKSGRRIFGGEPIGERNRHALGPICCGHCLGNLQLLAERGRETSRESYDPSLVAFSLIDEKPGLNQIKVFDPQIERFIDPQSAGIEQVNNQAGWVTVEVTNRSQQLADLSGRRTFAEGRRAFGAQGLDVAELLLEYRAVKEEQGIECLVLGGDGNAGGSDVGEKSFDFEFRCGGWGRWLGLEKLAISAQPKGISLLGAEGEMFLSTNLSDCQRAVKTSQGWADENQPL